MFIYKYIVCLYHVTENIIVQYRRVQVYKNRTLKYRCKCVQYIYMTAIYIQIHIYVCVLVNVYKNITVLFLYYHKYVHISILSILWKYTGCVFVHISRTWILKVLWVVLTKFNGFLSIPFGLVTNEHCMVFSHFYFCEYLLKEYWCSTCWRKHQDHDKTVKNTTVLTVKELVGSPAPSCSLWLLFGSSHHIILSRMFQYNRLNKHTQWWTDVYLWLTFRGELFSVTI